MNIKEQQKLADRQDYLVDRLTNGEEEFLDMLEEFYDISITLNGLGKKEEKWTRICIDNGEKRICCFSALKIE